MRDNENGPNQWNNAMTNIVRISWTESSMNPNLNLSFPINKMVSRNGACLLRKVLNVWSLKYCTYTLSLGSYIRQHKVIASSSVISNGSHINIWHPPEWALSCRQECEREERSCLITSFQFRCENVWWWGYVAQSNAFDNDRKQQAGAVWHTIHTYG